MVVVEYVGDCELESSILVYSLKRGDECASSAMHYGHDMTEALDHHRERGTFPIFGISCLLQRIVQLARRGVLHSGLLGQECPHEE